jgi:NADH dehydrogenase
MRTLLQHRAAAEGKKVVVIIGAGFAGLNAAMGLRRKPGVHVVIIDQRNHHLFQPLLYQVATAGLNPADIAVPIRAQFKDAPNVDVHLGRVDGVDLARRVVYGAGNEVAYDYLIVAAGAQHSYFGHDEWEPFAPGLKTLEQSTEIRRRLLSAFEWAENELDPAKQRQDLTFVVVGGGPTGVELAGAIADISRTVMVADFRRIDPSKARVILVEAASRVLGAFPADLSARAERDLAELGVEVMTNAKVDEISERGVRIADRWIETQTVFWAAGVQASRFAFQPEVPRDRAGRVKVGSDLSVPGAPEVFVAGDMATVRTEAGEEVPGVAPAAIQAGAYLARTILRDIAGAPRKPFRYLDKGIMATIGKVRAVARVGNLRMTGFLAWCAWLFVHVYYLIGFKNRLGVLWTWGWSYLFSKRGARLITEREWRLRN